MLDAYAEVTGQDVINHLRQLAQPLRGMRIVHINSTRVGGGVAEILAKLVPLTRELGLETSWEVIEGSDEFFQCTKGMHNALQGNRVKIPEKLLRTYERVNRENGERLRGKLKDADFVFIHDPQPAPLLGTCPDRKGKWIWRCHIDASRPFRPIWNYLREFVAGYDASIFSLADFAQTLPHPQYIIPPSIDPLSEKNVELPEEDVRSVMDSFELDATRPLLVQISRFDRFKDPVGVIQAYQLVKKFVPGQQLVLAGGSATDDPEGEAVMAEVRQASGDDPDVHVLLLPPNSNRTVNALQRAATIVVQKSIREGFGLTVTEALWKGKPVIGGDTGGIRLQVINFNTGFRVVTPEGAALRIRYLLHQPKLMSAIGEQARQFVKENFLLTRHLREYLTLLLSLHYGGVERIELG